MSWFVFHQGFQTPRNNKSTPPSASCFHLFLGVWNPDETFALVFDLLLKNLVQMYKMVFISPQIKTNVEIGLTTVTGTLIVLTSLARLTVHVDEDIQGMAWHVLVGKVCIRA